VPIAAGACKTSQTQHGLLTRLKFWRRRDVKHDIRTHIEQLKKRLEEREATLEDKLKERNVKSEQVEATLCSHVSKLEEV
jgi:hypothetical protein